MDNHRAALWCWQQEIDLATLKHSILHIDRHTDCLGANLDLHVRTMPILQRLSIEDYLNAHVDMAHGPAALFRWDNYLSIHIAAFRSNLCQLISADHDDGDKPDHSSTRRPTPDELPENILYWLKRAQAPWIVNVDLDYFFCTGPSNENGDEGEWLPLFSDDYIEAVFAGIKAGLDAELVKAVTICLTPSDYTPGWQECLDLSRKMFDVLGARHPEI